MTVNKLIKRQNEILKKFGVNQQKLIIEAINIEYKLALVEEGYPINRIN